MRNVWVVMLDKTEQQVKCAQRSLVLVNQKKRLISTNMTRLDDLVAEYIKGLGRALAVADRLVVTQYYNNFITEIQQARKGLERDMAMIDVDFETARASLREAEQAHMKSKKLVERQALRHLVATTKLEAREQDIASALHFNFRNS